MSKNNIHFQTSFSNDSRKIITKEYNLASDDEILLAVWFSDRTYSIFERRGFVVTKNGLAWNFVTMAETAAADGAKERAPRNTNFLDSGKVIIFLAILLLVLLTMQFSMGFSARVVKVKAVFFVLFSIIFYLVIHTTLYDEFAKQVREMLNIMKLPVKWW